MKSPVWRAIALLTLVAVVMGMASDANAARRSALAGNLFINDADDMFAFPQLYTQYQNMAIIDFAPSSYGDDMSGNASLIWGGEKHTIRVSTGRTDLAARTAAWTWGQFDRGTAMPGGSLFTGLGDAQWFDFGWSTLLGDMPFGIGFSWLKDSNSFEATDGTTDPDESFGHYTLQVGLTPGSTQLALEVGFGGGDDKAVPDDGAKFSTLNAALTARGDLENFAGFAWRYLVGFSYGKLSPKADTAEDYTEMAFRGSFGPVFGTPGEWEVAGYITYDFQSYEDKGVADTEDTVKDGSSTFPGYNLAGEYYLNNWFAFRAGVQSSFISEKMEEDFAAGTETDKETNYYYMWTMGFGIDKDAWGLDFALQEGNVHSGYFLNGDIGGDAFAYISGWFNW